MLKMINMFDKNDEKKKEILKVCNIYLQIKKEGKDNKIKISEITIGNNNFYNNKYLYKNIQKINEKLDKDKFNSLISSSSPDQKIKKNLEKLKKSYQILKRRLIYEYKRNFELKLHIKFEKKRENEDIYIINATYTQQENKIKFTDDNILIIENESNLKGFNSLLDYINKEIKNENINKSENNKEEKIIADENKDDCDAKNKKDNLNRIVIDYEKDKIKIMTKKETYQFNSDLIKEIYSDVYLLVDNEKNLVKIVDKDWKDKGF